MRKFIGEWVFMEKDFQPTEDSEESMPALDVVPNTEHVNAQQELQPEGARSGDGGSEIQERYFPCVPQGQIL